MRSCGLLLQLENEMLLHLVHFLVEFVVLLCFIHNSLTIVPACEVFIDWELLRLYSLLIQVLPSEHVRPDIESKFFVLSRE